jgi:hypothetical protein
MGYLFRGPVSSIEIPAKSATPLHVQNSRLRSPLFSIKAGQNSRTCKELGWSGIRGFGWGVLCETSAFGYGWERGCRRKPAGKDIEQDAPGVGIRSVFPCTCTWQAVVNLIDKVRRRVHGA